MREILPEKPPSDYIMFPFIGLLVFVIFMPFYTNIFYTWHDYWLYTLLTGINERFSQMLLGRMSMGRTLSGFGYVAFNYIQLQLQNIWLIAVFIKCVKFINAFLFCFFLYKALFKISKSWKFAIFVIILAVNLTGVLFYFITNYTVVINLFMWLPLISVYLVSDPQKSISNNKNIYFFAILLCFMSLNYYNWHTFVVPSFAVFALLFSPKTIEERYQIAINILTVFFFAVIFYFVTIKTLILIFKLPPLHESQAFKFGFQNIIDGLSFHFNYVLNFWFLSKGFFHKFYVLTEVILVLAIFFFVRQDFVLSKNKLSILAVRLGTIFLAIGFCQSYFIVKHPHFLRIHLGLALMSLFFCIWLVQQGLEKIKTRGYDISGAVVVLAIFGVITIGHFNQNHYYIKPAQNEFAFIKGALASLNEGLVDVVRVKKGPYLWIAHDTYGSTVFSRFNFAPFAVRGFLNHAYSDLQGLPTTISSIKKSKLNFKIDKEGRFFDISKKYSKNLKNVMLTVDGAAAQAHVTSLSKIRSAMSLGDRLASISHIKSSYSQKNHEDFRAFDGSMSSDSFWEVDRNSFPCWWQITHRGVRTIQKYQLSSGALATRMPKDWKLEGSNDGNSWEEIDKRLNQVGWVPYEKRIFNITKPKAFRHYRLYFMKGNHPEIIRIYEIAFHP